jgi:hypothetical protein
MNIFQHKSELKNIHSLIFGDIFQHKSELKNIHSLIFGDFLKISQKSAILDCVTILKDFQKRSSTKY